MDYSIVFIIPNIPVVSSVKRMLEKLNCNYPVYLRSTAAAVTLAEELLPNGIKLIVSHGLTLEYLRRNLSIPVIDLPFSGLDALATAQKALELPGRIIHLGTQALHHYIQRSLAAIGEDPRRIEFFQLTMDRSVEEQAQDMIDAGYDVFIGGYSMVEYVKRAGKYGLEFDADELIIEATVRNAQELLNPSISASSAMSWIVLFCRRALTVSSPSIRTGVSSTSIRRPFRFSKSRRICCWGARWRRPWRNVV